MKSICLFIILLGQTLQSQNQIQKIKVKHQQTLNNHFFEFLELPEIPRLINKNDNDTKVIQVDDQKNQTEIKHAEQQYYQVLYDKVINQLNDKRLQLEKEIEPYKSFLTFSFLTSEMKIVQNYAANHRIYVLIFISLIFSSLFLLLVFNYWSKSGNNQKLEILLKGRQYDEVEKIEKFDNNKISGEKQESFKTKIQKLIDQNHIQTSIINQCETQKV